MSATIGDRIKELRLQKGLSQEELGEKIGVQKAAIHKYENNIVVNLKQSTISALADALEVSPAYLMGYEETMSHPIPHRPRYQSLNRGKIETALNEMGEISEDEDEEIAEFIAYIKSKRGN